MSKRQDFNKREGSAACGLRTRTLATIQACLDCSLPWSLSIGIFEHDDTHFQSIYLVRGGICLRREFGVMMFLLAGPTYFLDLLRGSVWHIAAISAVAGIVRLSCRRGGFGLSIICGAVIALAGFLTVLVYAVSRI